MPRERYSCVICTKRVTRSHRALQCGDCQNWCHIECGTRISPDVFDSLIAEGCGPIWYCNACKPTAAIQIDFDTSSSWPDVTATTDLPINPPISETLDVPSLDLPPLAVEVDLPDSEICTHNITLPLPSPDSEDFDLPPVTQFSDDEEDSIVQDINEISDNDDFAEDPTDYQIVEDGSQKQKSKLLDGRGFSFVVSRERGSKVYWRCSVRSKTLRCPATVIQDGLHFGAGFRPHEHPPADGLEAKVRVRCKAKKIAKENVHQSARDIVEDLLFKESGPRPRPNLPSLNNAIRATNRAREKLRPKHPKDLNFEVEHAHIEDNFLIDDIRVGQRRHLVFATKKQLEYLAGAKSWYLDGTFKAAKAPFTQLYSIHIFLHADGVIKQVPCAFLLMSGKSFRDYREVFRSLRDKIRDLNLETNIKPAVMDYERAVWKAIDSVFPTAKRRGCAFHWGQAVDRQVKSLGLVKAYKEDPGTRSTIKRILALQYLPAEHIPVVFRKISQDVTGTALVQLLDYLDDNWVTSKLFPPRTWSCYRRTVRTNNDVEGWHTRLNKKCHGQGLNLYLLVERLASESKMVPLLAQMVSEGQVCRRQTPGYHQKQQKLLDAWQQYDNGHISPFELLKRVR